MRIKHKLEVNLPVPFTRLPFREWGGSRGATHPGMPQEKNGQSSYSGMYLWCKHHSGKQQQAVFVHVEQAVYT